MPPTMMIETWGNDQPDPNLKNWRDTVPGIGRENPKRAIDDILDVCVREKHHESYGRPWCEGRTSFDHLVAVGLMPTDMVLDFGCGVGRSGIWLIEYLNAGRYFGVDSHRRSLEAFARYEIPLHGLGEKMPRLAHDAHQQFDKFGVAFDWILDFAASMHMPPETVPGYYERAVAVLRPGGRLVLKLNPAVQPPAELRLERVHEYRSYFVPEKVEQFYIFKKA